MYVSLHLSLLMQEQVAALQVFVSLATATDNINQNTTLQYFMISSRPLLDTLLEVLLVAMLTSMCAFRHTTTTRPEAVLSTPRRAYSTRRCAIWSSTTVSFSSCASSTTASTKCPTRTASFSPPWTGISVSYAPSPPPFFFLYLCSLD